VTAIPGIRAGDVDLQSSELPVELASAWEEGHGHSKKMSDEVGTIHSYEVSLHFSMIEMSERGKSW
jgi:hypothetical protein